MKMNFGLDLTQSQKLSLTKELKQSLAILQMNSYELEKIICQEVSENPTLDMEKKDEIDWERYLTDLSENRCRNLNSRYDSAEDDRVYNPESYIEEKKNRYDYLKSQLAFFNLPKEIFRIACYIIRTLDKDGYFREDLLSAVRHIKATETDFLEALHTVQKLDPPGIGARDVAECMMIQLRERGIDDQILYRIITEDLTEIAGKKYAQVCKKYQLSEDKFRAYIDCIRSLNPRPAQNLSDEEAEYVFPDVIVEEEEGQLRIVVNEDAIPHLRISPFYKKMLKNSEEEETKSYIRERLNRSVFFLRALKQRRKTILEVAECIVKEQREFFFFGKAFLKPMKLSDVAEKLNCHESTVSRTVKGKYMLTTKGLYEFRFFFVNGIASEDGEPVSSRNIKERIREMIAGEDKQKPLSDQKISEALSRDAIAVSRRTVAKYREEEGIPSSTMRKEI